MITVVETDCETGKWVILKEDFQNNEDLVAYRLGDAPTPDLVTLEKMARELKLDQPYEELRDKTAERMRLRGSFCSATTLARMLLLEYAPIPSVKIQYDSMASGVES